MIRLTTKPGILISVFFTLMMIINTLDAAVFVVQTDLDLGGGTTIAEISPGVFTIDTLRSAVEQANNEINFPGPDLIRFDENMTTVNPGANTTIILGLVGDQFDFQTQTSSSALGIDSTITIQGTPLDAPSEPDIYLKASGLRHFQVNSGGRLRLYDLILTDGETPLNSSGRGGAVVIDDDGKLEIINSLFIQNQAVNGGALAFQSGALDALIENSVFTLNTASDENNGTSNLGLGGAVFIDSGVHLTSIKNSVFAYNSADAHGGGIFTNQSIAVKNSRFLRNNTDLSGGALYISDPGNATISNGLFYDNLADLRGGALYVGSLSTNQSIIVNSTLAFNDAGFNLSRHLRRGAQTAGGAIYSGIDNSLLLHNNIITDNNDTGADDDISADLDEASSFNLIGLNSGSLFGVSDQANGNLIGTISEPLDAGLILNEFSTTVIGLASDSPAVNSGSNQQANDAGLTTDIEGNDRIIGSAVDRGAFETDVFFYSGFE